MTISIKLKRYQTYWRELAKRSKKNMLLYTLLMVSLASLTPPPTSSASPNHYLLLMRLSKEKRLFTNQLPSPSHNNHSSSPQFLNVNSNIGSSSRGGGNNYRRNSHGKQQSSLWDTSISCQSEQQSRRKPIHPAVLWLGLHTDVEHAYDVTVAIDTHLSDHIVDLKPEPA